MIVMDEIMRCSVDSIPLTVIRALRKRSLHLYKILNIVLKRAQLLHSNYPSYIRFTKNDRENFLLLLEITRIFVDRYADEHQFIFDFKGAVTIAFGFDSPLTKLTDKLLIYPFTTYDSSLDSLEQQC